MSNAAGRPVAEDALPEPRMWYEHATQRCSGMAPVGGTNEPLWDASDMRAAIAAERERCAAICDQRSADHWHDYKDPASPHRGHQRAEAASDEAYECAKAIRESAQ